MHPARRTSALLLLAIFLPACAPSDTDRRALEQGFADYSARNFDAAESAASVYIQKNPAAANLDEAFYLRGLAHFARGDFLAARQDLQAAIDKSQRPDLKAKALRALGDIAFDARQWDQALAAYQKSLAFAPEPRTDAHCSFNAGVCLQSLGQWDPARPYFQHVISRSADASLSALAVERLDARNFALQFGAFREAPKAADLIRQLKAAGIVASAESQLRAGQLIYLVRSGSYPTREQADLARARLLARYPALIVVP